MTTDPVTRGRVFVVDDNEVMRQMLVFYLERANDLSVCGAAASGHDALEQGSLDCCDLALLDVAMPGMSGIDLARHLRERHPHLKCLMLSGHAEQVYVIGALKAGAKGYVTKGDPDAILVAIRKVMQGETYLSKDVQRYWLQ